MGLVGTGSDKKLKHLEGGTESRGYPNKKNQFRFGVTLRTMLYNLLVQYI